MKEVEVKTCVITNILRRGRGMDDSDPVRIITQVWDAETGHLIAESDPCAPESKL